MRRVAPCAPIASVRRRQVVVACAALAGCATLPGIGDKSDPVALDRLIGAQKAHGFDAWRKLRDVAARYEGRWHTVGAKLQPVLNDAGYRGQCEERILVPARLVAQTHRGSAGVKQVVREPGLVRVAYNGIPTDEPQVRAAAALVADLYSMFLFGPLWFNGVDVVANTAPSETLEGHVCDTVVLAARPGLGLAHEDRFMLWIDRDRKLLRRVRYTLDGLDLTRGAVADVDFFDHASAGGMRWPTRFRETLVRPIPGLRVHEWRLTGLDLNRGMTRDELIGVRFSGNAMRPAVTLASRG